ncbi:uncharacterized protein C8R40DRAFT_1133408 [Lentinula edodes]|uniref:uncharacterized protein n=1 Tax=Lentinula edodes TaxID=5353 RepID=UPI001E8D7DB1|nr:uncharacterized protein C8R40DRAFT_1133408 [Lentinula edodes]KAH7868793.1 hypothetical protein C8R40DRAFT_1133408 [Lentinula edodes]
MYKWRNLFRPRFLEGLPLPTVAAATQTQFFILYSKKTTFVSFLCAIVLVIDISQGITYTVEGHVKADMDSLVLLQATEHRSGFDISRSFSPLLPPEKHASDSFDFIDVPHALSSTNSPKHLGPSPAPRKENRKQNLPSLNQFKEVRGTPSPALRYNLLPLIQKRGNTKRGRTSLYGNPKSSDTKPLVNDNTAIIASNDPLGTNVFDKLPEVALTPTLPFHSTVLCAEVHKANKPALCEVISSRAIHSCDTLTPKSGEGNQSKISPLNQDRDPHVHSSTLLAVSPSSDVRCSSFASMQREILHHPLSPTQHTGPLIPVVFPVPPVEIGTDPSDFSIPPNDEGRSCQVFWDAPQNEHFISAYDRGSSLVEEYEPPSVRRFSEAAASSETSEVAVREGDRERIINKILADQPLLRMHSVPSEVYSHSRPATPPPPHVKDEKDESATNDSTSTSTSLSIDLQDETTVAEVTDILVTSERFDDVQIPHTTGIKPLFGGSVPDDEYLPTPRNSPPSPNTLSTPSTFISCLAGKTSSPHESRVLSINQSSHPPPPHLSISSDSSSSNLDLLPSSRNFPQTSNSAKISKRRRQAPASSLTSPSRSCIGKRLSFGQTSLYSQTTANVEPTRRPEPETVRSSGVKKEQVVKKEEAVKEKCKEEKVVKKETTARELVKKEKAQEVKEEKVAKHEEKSVKREKVVREEKHVIREKRMKRRLDLIPSERNAARNPRPEKRHRLFLNEIHVNLWINDIQRISYLDKSYQVLDHIDGLKLFNVLVDIEERRFEVTLELLGAGNPSLAKSLGQLRKHRTRYDTMFDLKIRYKASQLVDYFAQKYNVANPHDGGSQI